MTAVLIWLIIGITLVSITTIVMRSVTRASIDNKAEAKLHRWIEGKEQVLADIQNDQRQLRRDWLAWKEESSGGVQDPAHRRPRG